jgi:cytoskeletal protein CcmA (bactofilin family)
MALFNTKTEGIDAPKLNIIGAGTTINGDINCVGDIRIEGAIIGNLTSTSKIIIGSQGKIEGNVSCLNADLEGKITGNIKVTELLTLKLTSQLIGDIETNKLSIEPGANFSGKCTMGNVSKENKSGLKVSNATKTI